MDKDFRNRLENAGFGVYDTPEELFAAIWDDPNRPLPVDIKETTMGKLKELLYSKMEAKGLTEAQEKQVMDFLETRVVCLTNIEHNIGDDIDWAIEQVLTQVSKDAIIEGLQKQIHDLNNQLQGKSLLIELDKVKLTKVLNNILNFEPNAWAEAKALLDELLEASKNSE